MLKKFMLENIAIFMDYGNQNNYIYRIKLIKKRTLNELHNKNAQYHLAFLYILYRQCCIYIYYIRCNLNFGRKSPITIIFL